MDSYQSHLVKDVQVCVMVVTFLLLGEEENALIGEYLSL